MPLNEDNYIDLAKHFQEERTNDNTGPSNVYVDWEGFATVPPRLFRLVKEISDDYTKYSNVPRDTFADLLLHYVHEDLDQAGHEPTKRQLQDVGAMLLNLLGARRWMKSGVDWNQTQPTYPKEAK